MGKWFCRWGCGECMMGVCKRRENCGDFVYRGNVLLYRGNIMLLIQEINESLVLVYFASSKISIIQYFVLQLSIFPLYQTSLSAHRTFQIRPGMEETVPIPS